MKQLCSILLFIISIQASAQLVTGKYASNESIVIYFETIAGVNNITINNIDPCEAEVEILYNNVTTKVALGPTHQYKYTLMAPVFTIQVRKITICDYPDNTEWVVINSEIMALEIPIKVSTKVKIIRICENKY